MGSSESMTDQASCTQGYRAPWSAATRASSQMKNTLLKELAVITMSIPSAATVLGKSAKLFTESQKVRGWKGTQKII